MSTEVAVLDPKTYGLEESKANEITSGLSQIISERKVLESMYSEVILLEITKENISKFRELRLKIRDNRTKGIETWRKANKEYSLRMGQFIDATAKKETIENERMEEALAENEKFFERQEAERIEKLKAQRIEECTPYSEFVPFGVDLGTLDGESYNSILNGAKLQLEAKKEAELKAENERIEAERIAEEKRAAEAKAEAERIEAQRIENERLKKEAEAREKQIEAERQQQIAENVERERLAEIERKKQAEIQSQKDAEIKKEREAREKLEAENKAKETARLEAERQAIFVAEKLAKAPVKKQLKQWVDSFQLPITNVDNETSKEIQAKFQAFKKWSETQINNL